MALKVKDWKRFQHFKDRKPPWIKLYRDILDDIKWHELSDSSAKLLISLWLLASEDKQQHGELPPLEEIAFRLRTDVRSIKTRISKLDHWLYQDDIETISDNNAISLRYQETRLETETETEKRQSAFALPDWIPSESWKGYEEMRNKSRKPMTDRARAMIVKQLESLKAQGHEPTAVLAQSEVHNWADVYAIKPNGGGNGKSQQSGVPDGKIKCRNPACGKIVSAHTDRMCDQCYVTRGQWNARLASA